MQYAHVPRPLALWDVQNAWAGRPRAVEMPSAALSLGIGTLLALRRLPFPERFEVPEATAGAILRTKARGGRVIAVGTSVTRALESAAARSGAGRLGAASGTTDLLLGPTTRLAVVDALLTGVHDSDTTHFQLLGAFAEHAVLEAALCTAEHAGFLGHELGDTWLVWRDPARGRGEPRIAEAGSATFAA